MKKINFTTIIGILLLSFVAYKVIKRYLFIPTMTFRNEQFTLLDNKQTTSIDGLKGKVLIVSCYQTWCGDCVRETPGLNELAGKINSADFMVIYLSDEPDEKVERFRQRFESGNITFAKPAKRLGELGIRSYPSTFLLNKKGEVIKTLMQGYNWAAEGKTIQQLLNE